jgi:methylmalonyl-CoA mutase
MLTDLHTRNANRIDELLRKLQEAAVLNKNIFEQLMEVSKYASLGQITSSLFEVGGQYRRNM